MGFLSKITKPLSKIPAAVGGVVVGVATGNPYLGFATYGALSGAKQYEAGRSLKKFGKEYELEQIALAEQYAANTIAGGIAYRDAANAAAASAKHQAHLLNAAAAQARELAAKNAGLVLDEGAETLRRTKKEHGQTEGTTRARLWASGLLANQGSLGKFQSSLHKENKKQQSWIQRAFEQQAEVVREGGDIQAALLKAQAVGASAGAAQMAAEGAAAFAQANLSAEQAIAQAQLSGDAYIRQGKNAMSSGLGQIGLAGFSAYAGLGGSAASVSSGGGGGASTVGWP